MQKIFRKLSVFAILIIVAMSVTGCSTQDDDHDVVKPPENVNNPDNPDNSFSRDTSLIPYIASRTIPRVIIIVPADAGRKVYVPYEDGPGRETRRSLPPEIPVITFYPENIDYVERFEVVFRETPSDILYKINDDENFEEVYSGETLIIPSQTGSYRLHVNALWIEDDGSTFDAIYTIKIVIGEPREKCNYIDWYHGGGDGLAFYESIYEILEFYDLLEEYYETVDEYLSTVCIGEYTGGECPCYMQTKADIQDLFSWLRLKELRLPYSADIPFLQMNIRNRYADVYVSYIIDDMYYTFNMNPPDYRPSIEEEIADPDNQRRDSFELIATAGDVNYYMYVYDRDEIPLLSFSISVNGETIGCAVRIPCIDPDTCDRGWDFGGGHECYGEKIDIQAAIDGLLKFDFIKLIEMPLD